jgi:peptidoglycan/LPS O-acetylase OafA/YrhL
VRRIFPSLALVLFSTLLIGWFVLFPVEFRNLGKHTAGGAAFIANLLLWKESGYFDNAAETKPLLHMWSLAIEEQFYLFWPLLIMLVRRWRQSVLPWVLGLLAVSMACNLIWIGLDQATAFYLPLSRFWELLVGAALAVIRPSISTKSTSRSDISSVVGILLLVAAIIGFNKDIAFPGAWAMVPTMGAALLIASGPSAIVNRTLLSSRPAVWFGLISYPLYLWHWPLLSFGRIVECDVPGASVRMASALLSVALAWLTYRYVETPLRFGNWAHRAVKPLLTAVSLLLLAGGLVYQVKPLADHQPLASYQSSLTYDYFGGKSEPEFWATSCFVMEGRSKIFQRNRCGETRYPGQPRIVLVGDSHSAYLANGLRPLIENQGWNFNQYSTAQCTPFSIHDRRARCRELNEYIEREIGRLRPDLLIMFAHNLQRDRSPFYGEPMPFDQFLLETIHRFHTAGARQILLIGQMPTWKDGLPNIAVRQHLVHGKNVPERGKQGLDEAALAWDTHMARLSLPNGAQYVSMQDFLCDHRGCLMRLGPRIPQDLTVWDYGHLTLTGSTYTSEKLLWPKISRAIQGNAPH